MSYRRNVLLFFVTTYYISFLYADIRKHVIGPWFGGFFSTMCSTLGNIAWADMVNKKPVVYWDHRSLYYQKEGYNGSVGNVWEYYFEPVSDASYTKNDLIYIGYCAPDHRTCIRGFTKHSYEYKKWVNSIITKYVRIKSAVQEKIDALYSEKIQGKKTIGIHLRGTDKQSEIRLPSPELLLQEANRVADEIEAEQFFIATDEEKLLKVAQEILNRPIVYCDSYRSSNGHPVHKRPQKAQLGEEVLIETLLLSMCDWFVCSHSNVAYFVMFFNPEIPNSFLERPRDIQEKPKKIDLIFAILERLFDMPMKECDDEQ
jgi:hypothetical protein